MFRLRITSYDFLFLYEKIVFIRDLFFRETEAWNANKVKYLNQLIQAMLLRFAEYNISIFIV